jgi:hypothetical protein
METWSRILNRRQRIRDMREKKAKERTKEKKKRIRVRTSFFPLREKFSCPLPHILTGSAFTLYPIPPRKISWVGLPPGSAGCPSSTVDSLGVFICNHQTTSKPTAVS